MTKKVYAVKCLLKEQAHISEHYKMIEEELEYVLSPYMMSIEYHDDELFVNSIRADKKKYPVLIMDWVEEVTLQKYLSEYELDEYHLSCIAYNFSKLTKWLMPQPFSHGDINLDNIMVRNDDSLVLVDYDSMYVPKMKGQKARELGCPNFQHPLRTEDDFNEHIDDFPCISMLLSLCTTQVQLRTAI